MFNQIKVAKNPKKKKKKEEQKKKPHPERETERRT